MSFEDYLLTTNVVEDLSKKYWDLMYIDNQFITEDDFATMLPVSLNDWKCDGAVNYFKKYWTIYY